MMVTPKKPKAPKPGKRRWCAGWYEVWHAVIAGGFTLAGAIGALCTEDNIQYVLSHQGKVYAGLAALGTVIRFAQLVFQDNTKCKS